MNTEIRITAVRLAATLVINMYSAARITAAADEILIWIGKGADEHEVTLRVSALEAYLSAHPAGLSGAQQLLRGAEALLAYYTHWS